MTQETLREAVARELCKAAGGNPDAISYLEEIPCWRYWIPQADAAIATMFKRLRTPSRDMVTAGCEAWGIKLTDQNWDEMAEVWQAMLAAFQQENSDATGRSIATRLHPDNPHGDGAWE